MRPQHIYLDREFHSTGQGRHFSARLLLFLNKDRGKLAEEEDLKRKGKKWAVVKTSNGEAREGSHGPRPLKGKEKKSSVAE